MKITIKADVDGTKDYEQEITFTNEELNNHNFVEMITKDKTYMIPVEDLWLVAEVFDRLREANK